MATMRSLLFALYCVLATASPQPTTPLARGLLVDPYAPYNISCPVKPQSRVASGLSPEELAYVLPRQGHANSSLGQWLDKVLGSSASFQDSQLPRLALALSGGGPKAGMTTAGLVEAFDSRDSSAAVAGLLQGMTYMTALSGGSLTISGVMANNFAKISDLKARLYNINYQNPFLIPILNDVQIVADVDAKHHAGFRTSVVDSYGRAISYDFIGGSGGGNGLTWSGIMTQSSFQSFAAPFPIITLSDSDVPQGQCLPVPTGPVWEFTPYEFGSWNPEVEAFFPTQYLGSPLSQASSGPYDGICTLGFDNVGFFTGISADTFFQSNNSCTTDGEETLTLFPEIIDVLVPADTEKSPFGIVPNPFYQDRSAGPVNEREYLYMQDGGGTGQVIPLFPLLQEDRAVDVIFAIDAESESSTNIANGQSLYNTYVQAQNLNLTRMPAVPTVATYAAQNLSARAQFFGCHDAAAATIVYIPNTEETQTSSSDYFFSYAQVQTVFNGGIQMATQMNDTRWPACVACAVLHKTAGVRLPDECAACLTEYCWTG